MDTFGNDDTVRHRCLLPDWVLWASTCPSLIRHVHIRRYQKKAGHIFKSLDTIYCWFNMNNKSKLLVTLLSLLAAVVQSAFYHVTSANAPRNLWSCFRSLQLFLRSIFFSGRTVDGVLIWNGACLDVDGFRLKTHKLKWTRFSVDTAWVS